MEFIIERQIELSGSAHSTELKAIMSGNSGDAEQKTDRADALEASLSGHQSEVAQTTKMTTDVLLGLQEQMKIMRETQELILGRMGVQIPTSTPEGAGAAPPVPPASQQ